MGEFPIGWGKNGRKGVCHFDREEIFFGSPIREVKFAVPIHFFEISEWSDHEENVE